MSGNQPSQPNQPQQPGQSQSPGSSAQGGGGRRPPSRGRRKKHSWDWWLQALIIPVTLVILAAILNTCQSDLSNQLSSAQHANDIAIASDQQQETDLNNYLSNMSTLLMNRDLRSATASDGPDLRSLARVQTLTILNEFKNTGVNGLNNAGVRKARVMRFLHDAGLIKRGDSNLSVPVASLDGADFSGASLSGFDLGGADLAQVNLSGADLSSADLMGATLSHADLKGANLKGAILDYTQLDSADLSCGDKHCTDLTNADLSGADFVNANLAGAIFKHTDVSGTDMSGASPKDYVTQAINNGTYTTVWGIVKEHNALKISYKNPQGSIALYGILDLNTGKLQMIYGPFGKAGASVILFPALWSYTSCVVDYCQSPPVTGGSYTALLFGDNSPIPRELSQNQALSFTVLGTVADLSVTDTVTFSPPDANSITVKVSASATGAGTITLDKNLSGQPSDTLHREAFKPVILTAMYDSTGTWTTQKAFLGNQSALPPLNDTYTRIPSPSQRPSKETSFKLMGGTSSSVTNAPTISVTLNSLSASNSLTRASIDLMSKVSASLQVQPSSDQSVDNVNMWDGVDAPSPKDQWSYPDQWSYTVVASNPY